MGGSKLSMKLIANHKIRKTTFHQRKTSLMKKAYELSTLCDVRTCVLIHSPTQELHTWPENRNEVESMIAAYRDDSLQKGPKKCFSLCDFFLDRKKKIESERLKLCRDALENRYPKWDEQLDHLSEEELMQLMDKLSAKINLANSWIGGDDDHSNHHHPHVETPIDLSHLLNAGSSGEQIEYNYQHLQPLFYNDPMNNMVAFNNPIPDYSICMPQASASASDTASDNLANSWIGGDDDHSNHHHPHVAIPIDLSHLLYGGSSGEQIEYNYQHLQPLFYNDPMNNMVAFNNPIPDYSICMPQASASASDTVSDTASSEVHYDLQLDSFEYEYLMSLLTSQV